MKVVLKAGLILFSIVVFFLIIILGVFIYNKNINHVAYVGRYTSFTVNGESMEPTIIKTDLIIVKKQKTYEVDDIISFRNEDGGITTHRIIEKDNEGYTTKGDNNGFTDGYKVKEEDIYGKVVTNLRGLNLVLAAIVKYRYFFIAAVFLIPIIFKFLIRVS